MFPLIIIYCYKILSWSIARVNLGSNPTKYAIDSKLLSIAYTAADRGVNADITIELIWRPTTWCNNNESWWHFMDVPPAHEMRDMTIINKTIKNYDVCKACYRFRTDTLNNDIIFNVLWMCKTWKSY